jgi:5-methylcytosine-specific restriction protein A
VSREKFKLWIGKNDRAMPPENVQLRILQRYKACCLGCGRKLMMGEKWELDHVIPLEDGGVNAEGNLQPLCKPCHGKKTGREATERAKVRAMTKAAYGIKLAPKQRIRSAGFPKSRKAPAPKPRLSPKAIYTRGELLAVGNAEGD